MSNSDAIMSITNHIITLSYLYYVFIRSISFNCRIVFITFNLKVAAFAVHQPIESAILTINAECIIFHIYFACTEDFHFTIVNMGNLNRKIIASITQLSKIGWKLYCHRCSIHNLALASVINPDFRSF